MILYASTELLRLYGSDPGPELTSSTTDWANLKADDHGNSRDSSKRYSNRTTMQLQLPQMVTNPFLSFRNEVCSTISFFSVRHSTRELAPGTRTHARCLVFFWKSAQILTAEKYAVFSPPPEAELHPLMFADYRVPQVLHYLYCSPTRTLSSER
jgi:hypothetical protein